MGGSTSVQPFCVELLFHSSTFLSQVRLIHDLSRHLDKIPLRRHLEAAFFSHTPATPPPPLSFALSPGHLQYRYGQPNRPIPSPPPRYLCIGYLFPLTTLLSFPILNRFCMFSTSKLQPLFSGFPHNWGYPFFFFPPVLALVHTCVLVASSVSSPTVRDAPFRYLFFFFHFNGPDCFFFSCIGVPPLVLKPEAV